MEIIILLIAGLVIAFLVKPHNRNNYNRAILAIFGISYFVIWRFLRFYSEIHHWEDKTVFTSLLILLGLTSMIVVLPPVQKVQKPPSLILAGLFLILATIGYIMEYEIKNQIATLSGYYNNPPPVLRGSIVKEISKTFNHTTAGFVINLPSDWEKRQHKTGLEYFVLSKNEKISAELRPGCFHNSPLTLAEIVSESRKAYESAGIIIHQHCFLIENSYSACLLKGIVKKSTSNIKERWTLHASHLQVQQNATVDLVFYDDKKSARRDAEGIIRSFRLQVLQPPLPVCANTIDWF